MDDISAKLNQILSDPQSMEQIKNIMGSMGGQSGGDNKPQSATAPAGASGGLDTLGSLGGLGDLSALSGLGGLGGSGGLDLMSTVTKLAPLLSKAQQEDDTTRLLNALRPLLSEKRQKKIDEAIKILHILRILPMVRETGILSSILG